MTYTCSTTWAIFRTLLMAVHQGSTQKSQTGNVITKDILSAKIQPTSTPLTRFFSGSPWLIVSFEVSIEPLISLWAFLQIMNRLQWVNYLGLACGGIFIVPRKLYYCQRSPHEWETWQISAAMFWISCGVSTSIIHAFISPSCTCARNGKSWNHFHFFFLRNYWNWITSCVK